MKLNPKNILFGGDEGKKGPVLLAVTPPRTGERTLLGVENLPMGLQIVGRPFAEETVMKVAHAYEQNTDWHTRRPPI